MDKDKIEILMTQLLKRFNDNYQFLCNNDNVAGYYEAMDYGDEIIKKYPNFVKLFNTKREDFLTSDREVAAFGFALDDLDVNFS